MNPPAAVIEYAADAHPRPVPPYEVVIVQQQWASDPPDPFQVIGSMRGIVEHALQIPKVVSNPLFLRILEGLRSDYTVFDQVPAPRRRSRSPREYGLGIMTYVVLFMMFCWICM